MNDTFSAHPRMPGCQSFPPLRMVSQTVPGISSKTRRQAQEVCSENPGISFVYPIGFAVLPWDLYLSHSFRIRTPTEHNRNRKILKRQAETVSGFRLVKLVRISLRKEVFSSDSNGLESLDTNETCRLTYYGCLIWSVCR